MTNNEIAAALVKVRRGEKKLWNVYAPGQPGQRQLQAAFTSKKDAERHAFHITAHVAAILDAADRLRGPMVIRVKSNKKLSKMLANMNPYAGRITRGER